MNIVNKILMTSHIEKATVLIADPSLSGLNLLFDYLVGSGFRVLVAKDGESVLMQANYAQPDIILLEALMPDINGFEICRRLKAGAETKAIPIIFMTSLSHAVDKVKGFKLGAVAYLTKPLECEEVLVHINTHLIIQNLQKSLLEQNIKLQKENLKGKKFLNALYKNNERYRLMAENSSDIISRQTLAGIYHYVSPACRTMLGYEIEEMLGCSAFDFFHPEDLQAIKGSNGTPTPKWPAIPTITYRARRKDNQYIWLEATSRIIRDPKTNEELEIIAISRNVTNRKEAAVVLQSAHDNLERRLAERVAQLAEANLILKREVTERKRIEVELQAYSDELKINNEDLSRLDKMKNEFLANTSHELRTPLNGIIGIAESMLAGATGQLTPEQMRNLSMIVFSGRRLTNLVNDTLDFSKLKHRELDLERKPVDMYSLVEVVLTMSKPLIGQKSLQLVNQLDIELPAVNADESRVQQILYNLIGNAIKFTEAGTITVRAIVEAETLAVTVSDSGIGIPLNKFEVIFQSFEQVDTSTTRDYDGTGLGLSITKQLVELHGGSISIESVVGEGSHFTFTLPLHKWPVSASALNQAIDALTIDIDPLSSSILSEIEPILVTPASELVKGKSSTILVVDDELINVQVLTNYLSLQNYAIIQAFDGFEALEVLQETKPDLILLDIMMPKMSGYEVCQKIREQYPAQELPIVLLTAKHQVSDLVAGFEIGANDYLTKPFDKNELLARVKTHLRFGKINTAYDRFVPHEFLRFLDKESIEDVNLGDQVQREMTILFADIRSFTTLSEDMTPQENFTFLNSYLSRVSPIIRQYNGFVDKYIGDAVMALFPEKVEDALQGAIAIQQEVLHYNAQRFKKDLMPINVGIGLHTGLLMLGTIGEEMRMEGTVIADAVNLASRMEGLTKLYGASIIVSERSLFSLPEPTNYHFRFLDRVRVKGKKEPVSIFEVFDGASQDIIALKLKTYTDFEKGLTYYHGGQFAEAKMCFEHVLKHNPKDKAAHFHLKRTIRFIKLGVPSAGEALRH